MEINCVILYSIEYKEILWRISNGTSKLWCCRNGCNGENLALNVESRGYTVAIYNRTTSKTEEVYKEHQDKNLVLTKTLEEFVGSLEKPRRIMLMVQAGAATDATIKSLLPLLDKGDILIDGGNTHFPDTMRRNAELADSGINFIGTGVSGGEKGAL